MPHSSIAQLRRLCLALPEVTERPSHGEATWFVRDKVSFVTTADHHHDDRVAFSCAARDGVQEDLGASAPERFLRPLYVGHRGWLGVWLDVPVDWDEISTLVESAYRAGSPRCSARWARKSDQLRVVARPPALNPQVFLTRLDSDLRGHRLRS